MIMNSSYLLSFTSVFICGFPISHKNDAWRKLLSVHIDNATCKNTGLKRVIRLLKSLFYVELKIIIHDGFNPLHV